MGWELRQGRWYLYRNLRVNGKPTKEYLAAQGGIGSVMALELATQQRRLRESRDRGREAAAHECAAINGVLAAAGRANESIRIVVEGILVALGFRNHRRGEWRMTRGPNILSELMGRVEDPPKKPGPLLNYHPPVGDAEAAELFAKARGGETGAAAAVRALIVQRGWVETIGNVGAQAARQFIADATAGDVVWKTAIEAKILEISRELGGAGDSMLEKLLIRRVLNGWLAVHLLEIRQTARPPAQIKEREYLDRAVSRAQKRYTEAITALARIRRLKLPVVLAQVNIMSKTTTTNADESQRIPNEQPELAEIPLPRGRTLRRMPP